MHTKRFVQFAIFSVCLSLILSVSAAEKVKKLILSGPPAAVSNPLIRMVEANVLSDVAEEVEFVLWKDPDQMRALALKGGVDFLAIPTNVTANLFNRGVDIKLLNVSVWGILWLVSRDPALQSLEDFKGKEIAVPFRGDMPDVVFGAIARQKGLDPKKDFAIRYVSSPIDAMQLLVMRRVDHALLIEPAAAMALRKTKSFPLSVVAPDLYRSVNLQTEWAEAFDRKPRIPQAGIALLDSELPDAVVQRFNEEHAKAVQWCRDNPQQTGEIVEQYTKMLMAEAVADSVVKSQMMHMSAIDSRAELEQFFNLLHETTPALIGGKLPTDAFYYDDAREQAVDVATGAASAIKQ